MRQVMKTWSKLGVAVFLATAPMSVGNLRAQTASIPGTTFPDFPVVQGKAFKFQKVADGVYYATGGTGGNQIVIVNDLDVLLVDDGNTPAAGRDLLEDMKLLTDKPVRYVVNTHFHYDHTSGNQLFGPGVDIIGQENVRTAMLTPGMLDREPYLTFKRNNETQVASLPAQIAQEPDAAKKTALEKQLAAAQVLKQQRSELKITPPNLTYSSQMVIHDGSREIQLLFLGRGHTAGDSLVFLPKERILVTGDLVTSNVAYLGDGFFDQWIKTLDAMGKLDFGLVLPGHGRPYEGKTLLTAWGAYLAELLKQVTALRGQGVSPEDAAKRVDMTAFAKYFPTIRGVGAEPRGVRRMYQWLDQKEGK